MSVMGKRIGHEKIAREKGYLYYISKDGYVWRVPTKVNVHGTKKQMSNEKIERKIGFMYYLDKEGYVSEAKIKDYTPYQIRPIEIPPIEIPYKKSQMREDDIGAYISHRCDEYHTAPWRFAFEEYLLNQGFQPIYGCKLDGQVTLFMEEKIKQAIKKSDVFVGVITSSWKETNLLGWPFREWNMWLSAKGEEKENGIMFAIDTSRSVAEFLSDIFSFEILSTQDITVINRFPEILFGDKTSAPIRATTEDKNMIEERIGVLTTNILSKRLAKKG